MKVLFIGGTGIISSACSELAVKNGIDLYHLNRGKSSSTRKVAGVKNIIADIWNISEAKKAIANQEFDAVVDFISFSPENIRDRINLFRGKTKQFVFISSASIYETPPSVLPITENTLCNNPIWEYSQNKIACENILIQEYNSNGFPATIIRPSHTYDKTLLPMEGGYTVLNRIIEGKPVIVHGDGASIWTLTHHKDFAVGLVGLLGNKQAIGEAFHITSDEWLSWDNIYKLVGKAAGKDVKIIHVPSEIIAKYNKEIGDSLLGDKTHSMIFDNTKIKSFVPEFKCTIPFEHGAKEIVDWYKNNPEYQIVDESINKTFDSILENYS